MRDDWIHTEIIGEDDKQTNKGSFVSGTLVVMIVVAVVLLLIAFRGLFMSGGQLEDEKTDTKQDQQIAAPKTEDKKTTDTTTDEKETETTQITYTVKAGDTLGAIGAQFKVDYKDIAAANKLEVPYDLSIGQKLVIPGAAAAEEETTPADEETATEEETTTDEETVTATDSGEIYTVKAEDTLAGIGAELGVDWKEMAALNDLTFPYDITIGQKLKIPEAEE